MNTTHAPQVRVGTCKVLNRQVLQVRDDASDDAPDEPGWLCLHDETEEEERQAIERFQANA